MKEMQDNNLFGEDSTPTSPVPMIKEIALRDITQAVDLTEFRKQNYEAKHNCTDFLLPVGNSGTDDASSCDYPAANNDNFDWTTSQEESEDTPVVISNNGYCEKIENETGTEPNNKPTSKVTSVSCAVTHTYSSPVYESSPTLGTIDENSASRKREHLYAVPTDVAEGHITPNGDVTSKDHSPYRKQIKFALDLDTSPDSTAADDKPLRRSSVPDSKLPKESRTFHPLKRQTVHARRDKTLSSFNLEKCSKEELLLMWKSSEVDLTEKLQAAVKDKQRLETKLTSMKSTAV